MASKPTDHYLIGPQKSVMTRSKPPTLREMLQYFFFCHKEEKSTIKNSIIKTIDTAENIFEELKIPTKRSDKCREILQKDYTEWYSLYRNQHLNSTGQEKRRDNLRVRLDTVFPMVINEIPKQSEKRNKNKDTGVVVPSKIESKKRRLSLQNDQKLCKSSRLTGVTEVEILGTFSFFSSFDCGFQNALLRLLH